MKNLIIPLLFGVTASGRTTIEIIKHRNPTSESCVAVGFVCLHTIADEELVFLSKERQSIKDLLHPLNHKIIQVTFFCSTVLHADQRYRKWSGLLNSATLTTSDGSQIDLLEKLTAYEGKWVQLIVQWNL